MTALIGGLCVGFLWGAWATRQLLKRKKEIKEVIERNKARNAKLEVILTKAGHGKETEGKTKEAGKDTD